MGRPRTWTDEQLCAAVAKATSYKVTLRLLGLNPSGVGHYIVKGRIAELGLDISHFVKRNEPRYPWTDEELRSACSQASTRVDVLARLGLQPDHGNLQRLRRHMLELGLHLALDVDRRGVSARWTDDQLREAVASSPSFRQVLIKLGLAPEGGNYSRMQRRVTALGLSTEHFKGQGWNAGWAFDPRMKARPLEEMLVAGRKMTTQHLKERLFRAGLKQPKCELCGWAERSADGRLPVELDHINGDNSDNRLENLRILCPNCHSLQPTHRGSNQKRRARVS